MKSDTHSPFVEIPEFDIKSLSEMLGRMKWYNISLKFEKPYFIEMNYNKLWKLLIDHHMTKTEMRLSVWLVDRYTCKEGQRRGDPKRDTSSNL